MKINGNSLKNGMIIEHKGGMWKVINTQAVKPGKGGAFNQVELKNIETSTKLNERFRSNETVERLYVESKNYQYTYEDKGILSFMDSVSYEEVLVNASLLGRSRAFLQDGMKVEIEFIDNKVVSVKLPEHVIEEVVDTEAVIKGQTATSSFKPAILSNGAKIMVPGHVGNGMKVVVSSSLFEYIERAKV